MRMKTCASRKFHYNSSYSLSQRFPQYLNYEKLENFSFVCSVSMWAQLGKSETTQAFFSVQIVSNLLI